MLACGSAVPELASVAELDPSLRIEMRYARDRNFVGAPIDGYRAARCLLTDPAAAALVAVQRDLAAHGLTLVLFDCYRPQRSVDEFVRWAADVSDHSTKPAYYPRVAKERLLTEGYIADRSSHSRGSTVDVGLARRADGAPLDMGTPFDFFDPLSHTDAPDIADAARANRNLLRDAMERRGFRNYPKEWWHFTLDPEPYPETYFDVPVE